MPENQTLIIWLMDGTTCKFERVEHFREYEEDIKFFYFGVLTQVEREATFMKHSIAGYALES